MSKNHVIPYNIRNYAPILPIGGGRSYTLRGGVAHMETGGLYDINKRPRILLLRRRLCRVDNRAAEHTVRRVTII
jgi:hypothetical protein